MANGNFWEGMTQGFGVGLQQAQQHRELMLRQEAQQALQRHRRRQLNAQITHQEQLRKLRRKEFEAGQPVRDAQARYYGAQADALKRENEMQQPITPTAEQVEASGGLLQEGRQYLPGQVMEAIEAGQNLALRGRQVGAQETTAEILADLRQTQIDQANLQRQVAEAVSRVQTMPRASQSPSIEEGRSLLGYVGDFITFPWRHNIATMAWDAFQGPRRARNTQEFAGSLQGIGDTIAQVREIAGENPMALQAALQRSGVPQRLTEDYILFRQAAEAGDLPEDEVPVIESLFRQHANQVGLNLDRMYRQATMPATGSQTQE